MTVSISTNSSLGVVGFMKGIELSSDLSKGGLIGKLELLIDPCLMLGSDRAGAAFIRGIEGE